MQLVEARATRADLLRAIALCGAPLGLRLDPTRRASRDGEFPLQDNLFPLLINTPPPPIINKSSQK